MRLEDWQKWLDSQFVDVEEKKAPEPPRAVQETLLFDAPEEPAQAETALPSQAIIEQPIAPPRAAHTPEAVAPPAPEPVPQPPASPVSEATRRESQAIPDSPADMPEEIEVPSIERYLPFLFGRQPEETPKKTDAETAEETAEPPAPEIVTPVVLEERAQEPEPVLESVPEEIVAEEPQSEESPAEVSPEPIMAAQEPAVAPEPAVVPIEENPVAAKSATPSASELTKPARAEQAKKPVPKPENRRYGISRRRSRHARNIKPTEVVEEISAESLWGLVPRHIQTLIAIGAQTEVAQNSYKRQFKESRLEMIQRLLDPTLSLADTARLLNVCPTTVRRYTNRGLLTHQRQGKDRRSFKLSDVLAFLEAQSQARSKQP